jgi:hypothetical protein
MGVRVDIKGRWPFSTCKPKDSDLSSSGDPNLPTSHYIFFSFQTSTHYRKRHPTLPLSPISLTLTIKLNNR